MSTPILVLRIAKKKEKKKKKKNKKTGMLGSGGGGRERGCRTSLLLVIFGVNISSRRQTGGDGERTGRTVQISAKQNRRGQKKKKKF